MGSITCFAAVLSFAEAAAFAHNRARHSFVEMGGIMQPAPSPRFGRTPAGLPAPPEEPGSSSHAVLRDWGIAAERIDDLERRSIIPPAS
jgi:alpha-methylacyl-CoA racemase